MNLNSNILLPLVAFLFHFSIAIAPADEPANSRTPPGEIADEEYIPLNQHELRKKLTSIQYDVTQNEATEPAFENRYWNNKMPGVYRCVVCDRELFSSKTKYRSGTGWPSFYAPIKSERVGHRSDFRLFYKRIEVHCRRCNAHLGHVFGDGPAPTGKRYCLNSAALKFVDTTAADKKRQPLTELAN